ncbi:MAG: DUF4920 domain-containing protein [Tunicatimonas sp.]
MKKYLSSFAIAVFISTATWAQSAQHFGERIDEENVISSTELVNTVAQEGTAEAKVAGEVTKVCAAKGCWMTMNVDGQEMMVRFKDYGFFVPKDAAGKTAVVQGQAKIDTVDVATLRHYAEDAGKPKAEIEAITEPEVKLSFEAAGVILRD